jgi:hypothetical protein
MYYNPICNSSQKKITNNSKQKWCSSILHKLIKYIYTIYLNCKVISVHDNVKKNNSSSNLTQNNCFNI